MNTQKIALITGASTGLGLHLALTLAKEGYVTYATMRNLEKSTALLELATAAGLELYVRQLDVQDTASVDRCIAEIVEQHQRIDVLINNAGVFHNETLEDMNLDTIRRQFEVNALSLLKVTHTLLPFLKEGSKVANITSRMGSVEDNGSGAYYGYRASKAALNAMGKSLALDLKSMGISVAMVHPGFVQTRMVGFNGDISAKEAATGIAARIEDLNLENTGGFWHSNGQTLPW